MSIEKLKDLKWYVEDEVYTQDVRADILALLDEAIARQSVKSEDVAEAIEYYKSHLAERLRDGKDEVTKRFETVITALQEYQPWVSVNERLPTEEDADKKGLVLTYDKLETQESFPWYSIEVWNATKDNKITHWKPLLEPPKGE